MTRFHNPVNDPPDSDWEDRRWAELEDKADIERQDRPSHHPSPEPGPHNRWLLVVTVAGIVAWIVATAMWLINKYMKPM